MSEFAVGDVPVVQEGDPLDEARRRVADAPAPFAVVVDREGRRVGSVDERGRHALIEAWHDTPIEALALDPEALEALDGGVPGIAILDDAANVISVVPTSAVAHYLASRGPSSKLMQDILIGGDIDLPEREYTCGFCGYKNRIGIVRRGFT